MVTVTETWTFVFADESPPPMADQPPEAPALAPTPLPPTPALPPEGAVDAAPTDGEHAGDG